MKEAFAGSDFTLAMASSSVPITLGLAGLSNPIWLSLICREVSLLGWAASAPSIIPSESGTPPEIVHNTPVPAQVMHSNTFRRLTSVLRSLFMGSLMVVLRDSSAPSAVTRPRQLLFPNHRRVKISTRACPLCPLKADKRADVTISPLCAISGLTRCSKRGAWISLLDHLVGAGEQRGWHLKAVPGRQPRQIAED